MSLRKIGKWYYVCYYDIDGKLHNVATGMTTKEDAQVIEQNIRTIVQTERSIRKAKRITERIAQATGGVIQTEKKVVVHQRGVIRIDEMFQTALKYRQLSDTHKKSFTRFTADMEEHGIRYADQVTPKIALDYLVRMYSNKGQNGKSFNNNKTILNTIFRLCLIESGLKDSPFENVMPMRLQEIQHHRALTQDEFLRAFQAAEEPWKTVSLIAWHTGARLETCKRIMQELLTNPSDSITIKPGKTSRFGRSVFIPIHTELRQWIDNILASGVDWKAWKFKEIKGKDRLSYYVSLLRSLGINDTEEGKASFHSLRSSFITICDQNKIARHIVRGIAGQTKDDITDLYSHDKEGAKEILNLPSLGVIPPKSGIQKVM